MPAKVWMGEVPKTCQLCNRELKDQFVDGRTRMGIWAIMCAFCHLDQRIGLGIGKGQRFDLKTLEKIG